MSSISFAAPDAGLWEKDGSHFPRPLTPLLQELFPEGFVKGIRGGTACYGLLLDHLEPAFINGFFYMKMMIVGAPPDAKGPPPEAVFRQVCAEHPETRARLRTAATVLQAKPWRDHIRNWDTVLKPRSTEAHLSLQSRDPKSMSDAELVTHLERCIENYRAMIYQHHVYTVSCLMPVGDFIGCVQEWTNLPASEITQALRGSTPISVGVTDEYLAALDAIAADEKARSILNASESASEVLRQLRALPGKTGNAISAYLDLVSHRVVGGFDISCLTAIETPEVLLKSLQSAPSQEHAAAAERGVRELTAKIRAAVPEQHRALFDELLQEARAVNRLRDERSYWSDLWASGIVRHAVLEAGRRVAAKGSIDEAEHLLDATSEEILGLLTGGARGKLVSAHELARRHDYRASVSVEDAPQFINGTPSPPPPLEWFPPETRRTMRAIDVAMSHVFGFEQKESEGKTVRGIAVSSGRYEGRARVIDKVEELSQLEQGEVLVTRSTSTSFNYVLPLVGAIVTDRGGLMSHAAIVAREYGLPGVVGCQVATRTIPNGAMVRVDADKGEVVVLS